MTEDEVFKILLDNLNHLHCHNCGKSAIDFIKRDESLIGCLHFDTGDASVGLGESVYWLCYECERDCINVEGVSK